MKEELYIDEQDTFTILSIDPGTISLGFAVIKVDIKTLDIKEAFAWTVDATRLDYYREDIIAVHGDKFARIIAHKRNFENVLRYYEPLIVTSETPFFNKLRPSAGGPLFELYTTLEQTVFEWDTQKPLYKMEPKLVKKMVGASANAKKPEMQAALKKIEELSSASLEFLDQHSIDALAVGYSYILKLRSSQHVETC